MSDTEALEGIDDGVPAAPPTIDTAKDVIQRAKDCRGECDACERTSFHALYQQHHAAGGEGMPSLPEGFEHMTNAAGVIKRCQSCAETPLCPWADQLDPERVLAFMQAHNDHAWSLSALQELLP